MYQDTITEFGIPALNDRFEMVRQLGNVFIVQPEILKTYLNESYLARIENRLLRPFVMQRSDYNDKSRKFWNDIFGEEDSSLTGASALVGASKEQVKKLGGLMHLDGKKDEARLPALPLRQGAM